MQDAQQLAVPGLLEHVNDRAEPLPPRNAARRVERCIQQPSGVARHWDQPPESRTPSCFSNYEAGSRCARSSRMRIAATFPARARSARTRINSASSGICSAGVNAASATNERRHADRDTPRACARASRRSTSRGLKRTVTRSVRSVTPNHPECLTLDTKNLFRAEPARYLFEITSRTRHPPTPSPPVPRGRAAGLGLRDRGLRARVGGAEDVSRAGPRHRRGRLDVALFLCHAGVSFPMRLRW